MSGDLTGRTAIVTGASRGIGRAIARRLADRGASVVIGYLRNEARVGQVGQPEDVADVVFLAGDQGRWMTGQNLGAGGGVL